MAKIIEDEITISFAKLVPNDADVESILNDKQKREIIQSFIELAQSIVDNDSIVIEDK